MRISHPSSRFLLETRRSKIDRKGVFAAQPIPARHKVIEYAGEKISMAEAQRRFRRSQQSKSFRICLAKLNRGWVVDGAVGGSGAEFINHSCSPNLFLKRQNGKLNFYARRAIRRGEELTLDYRLSSKVPLQVCRCGSKNCRGRMNLPS